MKRAGTLRFLVAALILRWAHSFATVQSPSKSIPTTRTHDAYLSRGLTEAVAGQSISFGNSNSKSKNNGFGLSPTRLAISTSPFVIQSPHRQTNDYEEAGAVDDGQQHREQYRSSKRQSRSHTNRKKHDWLDEFKTGSGEIVNPYQILKVARDADRKSIRASYIKMSRKFHPDGARHREILPGKCNNLEDVREEWERISLSYTILNCKRTRKRYDRHEALADPGRAVQRATLNAIGGSFAMVGKGIFGALTNVVQPSNNEAADDTSVIRRTHRVSDEIA
eukprot:CAMPEP_0198109342 /NCGR_PEP_ID=MMETSP1442-20131203/1361_1 /TAXON_ID= /ORGANISM="Craspedostauros australis, Strain CCMP3328" /LENGTH=278 /DNA_ID=CAMNT_0043764951 /DNA_START=204 /DNA_END=1040 /DNA_ORIENTATION=+